MCRLEEDSPDDEHCVLEICRELFHQPTLMYNFLYSLTNILLMNKENCALKLVDEESALNKCTVQTFTESEDTRCCVNIIFPPEDGHVNA